MKYKIIYADPAWSYNDKSLNRGGAQRHYSTMSIEDIKAMNVEEISDTDCTLFIWATFPLLQEALDVIKSWGFEFKTCAFVWVKANKKTAVEQYSFLPQDNIETFMGMGSWTRANAEICLLATKGKPKRINADVRQVIYAPIMKHSRKPDEARKRITRLCGDLPRIELFAREQAEGWSIWGNEVESDIKINY